VPTPALSDAVRDSPEPDDRAALLAARLALNATRLLRLLPPLFVVHLGHAAVFAWTKVGDGSPTAERWRLLILGAHASLALLAAALYLWVRSPRAARAGWAWPLVAGAYLLAGAAIAGIDQLVTPAMTPFLIAAFGIALTVRLEARQTVAVYGVALLGLVGAAELFQASATARVSVIVNGVTVSAIALAMSLLFTRAFLEAEKAKLTISRQRGELESLRGLLSVCSYCRKIRNETAQWEPLDHYISRHSEARFSHGICEDCLKRHFPEDD
jgi:hypothetical protein